MHAWVLDFQEVENADPAILMKGSSTNERKTTNFTKS